MRYGDPSTVHKYAAKAVAEGYKTVKLHEITLEAIEAGRRLTFSDEDFHA